MLSYFTGYCHFILNIRATLLEKILGRKLPLRWKQLNSYNHRPMVAMAVPPHNDKFLDLLMIVTVYITLYITHRLLCVILQNIHSFKLSVLITE